MKAPQPRHAFLLVAAALVGVAITIAVVLRRDEPPPLPKQPKVIGSLYPSNSIWRARLPADPDVDPGSAQKIEFWLRNIPHPNLTLREYAVAVVVATPDSPRYERIECWKYACPSMGDFGSVPIPAGTQPDPSDDGHLAIWDPVSKREWDFWISGCPDECGRAASGGAVATDLPNPQMKNGSANAAGWPLAAGLVRPEEIAAGEIKHPLVFSTPDVADDHVCPAVQNDGENRDPLALAEGTLLQLDPNVDVARLPIPPWQKTVARALQRYGMYLRDGGGSLAIGGENPVNRGDLWAAAGLEGASATFAPEFPWKEMRVLMPLAPWC